MSTATGSARTPERTGRTTEQQEARRAREVRWAFAIGFRRGRTVARAGVPADSAFGCSYLGGLHLAEGGDLSLHGADLFVSGAVPG